MRTQKMMSRLALARRLQEIALSIAAGKPVRVGGVAVIVPERVMLEEEFETNEGESELEFELKWGAALKKPAKAKKKPAKKAAAKRAR